LAVFRYLSVFHDAEQEKHRQAGKAFIPSPNEHLIALLEVNKDFAAFAQAQNPQSMATLDIVKGKLAPAEPWFFEKS